MRKKGGMEGDQVGRPLQVTRTGRPGYAESCVEVWRGVLRGMSWNIRLG